MANEATIQASLAIVKGNLTYRGLPTTFKGDVSGTNGPTPGALVVDTDGVNVDLSELTTPGYCRLMNLDATNYVNYGVWDPEISRFYPLGELRPGESYVIRLSRELSVEYGTGVGTSGPATNTFHLRASTANCNVLVEVFEA